MEDQVIYLVPPWWPFPEKESKRSSWTFDHWTTKVSLLTYSGEEELGGLSNEYGYEVNGSTP